MAVSDEVREAARVHVVSLDDEQVSYGHNTYNMYNRHHHHHHTKEQAPHTTLRRIRQLSATVTKGYGYSIDP